MSEESKETLIALAVLILAVTLIALVTASNDRTMQKDCISSTGHRCAETTTP